MNDCNTRTKFDKSWDLLEAFFSREKERGILIPIDVEGICEFQNLKLIKCNSDEDFVGKVFQDNNGQAEIHVNMNENQYYPRYRFTLAHEIAHYNLHLRDGQEYRDNNLTLFRKEDNWNKEEAEANQFAAGLLMPIGAVVKKAKEILDDVDSIGRKDFIAQLADAFEVSNMAMEYRLINIGIIEPTS